MASGGTQQHIRGLATFSGEPRAAIPFNRLVKLAGDVRRVEERARGAQIEPEHRCLQLAHLEAARDMQASASVLA